MGLASAGAFNAALVAIGELLPPERQSRALGVLSLVGSVCAIAGFPLIGQIAAIDYRLSLAVGIIALIYIPFVMTLPDKREAVAGEALPPAGRMAWLIMVCAVIAGMVAFIGTMFGPLFLTELGVTDPGLLSIPPTTASIGSTIGAVVFVALNARFGVRGVFVFSMAAMALGLLVVGTASGVWGVAAGTFVCIMGCGAFSPGINAAAIEASSQNPGPVLGLCNALYFGSMILFPLIAVPMAERVGGSKVVVLAYACVGLLMAFAFLVRRMSSPRAEGLAIATPVPPPPSLAK